MRSFDTIDFVLHDSSPKEESRIKINTIKHLKLTNREFKGDTIIYKEKQWRIL